MHEELYISEKSKIRWLMLGTGILLLPFSFFSFLTVDGAPQFSFRPDLPVLFAATVFIVIFFEKQVSSMMRFSYPYIAMLICLFCRFGTVTLFNREISFEFYIVSAAMMGCAFGYTFLLCFIGIGKMRSRLPLFAFNALCFAVAAVSLILRIIPFFAYDDTVKGHFCFSISDLAVYLIINAAALCVALSLRDDKAREERRKKREERRGNR